MTDSRARPADAPVAPAVVSRRVVVLRAVVATTIFAALLVANWIPSWPRSVEPAALVAVATLGLGLVGAGMLERRLALGGWQARRVSDAVVVVSTLAAGLATVQGIYAEGALSGGPQAGLDALASTWSSRPELFVIVPFQAAFAWGIPCGLMTLERLDPVAARAMRGLVIVGVVLTCGVIVFAVLPLWLADRTADWLDQRSARGDGST